MARLGPAALLCPLLGEDRTELADVPTSESGPLRTIDTAASGSRWQKLITGVARSNLATVFENLIPGRTMKRSVNQEIAMTITRQPGVSSFGIGPD